MKKKSGRRVSAARLLLCTLLCFLFAGGIKAEAGMLVTAADPSLSGNTGEEQRSKEEYFADLQAEPVTEPEQTPSRFVTVTLHAGRYGDNRAVYGRVCKMEACRRPHRTGRA